MDLFNFRNNVVGKIDTLRSITQIPKPASIISKMSIFNNSYSSGAMSSGISLIKSKTTQARTNIQKVYTPSTPKYYNPKKKLTGGSYGNSYGNKRGRGATDPCTFSQMNGLNNLNMTIDFLGILKGLLQPIDAMISGFFDMLNDIFNIDKLLDSLGVGKLLNGIDTIFKCITNLKNLFGPLGKNILSNIKDSLIPKFGNGKLTLPNFNFLKGFGEFKSPFGSDLFSSGKRGNILGDNLSLGNFDIFKPFSSVVGGAKSLTNFVSGLGGADPFGKLVNGAGGFGGFSNIISGFGGGSLGLGGLKGFIDQIPNPLESIGGIGNLLSKGVPDVTGMIDRLGGMGSFTDMLDKLKMPSFPGMPDGLPGLDAFNGIFDNIASMGGDIFGNVEGMIGKLGNFDGLGSLTEKLGGYLNFSDFTNGLGGFDGMSTFMEGIGSIGTDAFDNIANMMGGHGDMLNNLLEDGMGGFMDNLGGLADIAESVDMSEIDGWLGDIDGILGDKFISMEGNFDIEKVFDDLGGGLQENLNPFMDMIKGIEEQASEAMAFIEDKFDVPYEDKPIPDDAVTPNAASQVDNLV